LVSISTFNVQCSGRGKVYFSASTHAAVQGAVSRTSARVTKARGGKETLRFLGIEARQLRRRSGIRLNPERERQCAIVFHHAPDFAEVRRRVMARSRCC
jgi:hypothetical protein